jgi:hypothetical protein
LSSRLWNSSKVLGWGGFGGMSDPRRSFRRQVNHNSKSKETPSHERARNRKPLTWRLSAQSRSLKTDPRLAEGDSTNA